MGPSELHYDDYKLSAKRSSVDRHMYKVGQKNDPTCFCQNFIKSPPNLISCGTQIANMIELGEVHPLSTSSNLCQQTTV